MIRVTVSAELVARLLTQGELFPAGRVVTGIPPGARLVWIRPSVRGLCALDAVKLYFAESNESPAADAVWIGRAMADDGMREVVCSFEKAQVPAKED